MSAANINKKRSRKVAKKAIREKNIAIYATKSAKQAVRKATENKVSIVVARNGAVHKVNPDGTTEYISSLHKKFSVKNRFIKLGH